MPINNLMKPGIGLPEIGRIRKGAPKPQDKNMPGFDLKYFRVTFNPRYAALDTYFRDVYGEQPVAFDYVYMPGDTALEVFDAYYEEHVASRMVRQCDGDCQLRHIDPETGETVSDPIPCIAKQIKEMQKLKQDVSQMKSCGCRPRGRLKIMLPQFSTLTGIYGYFTLLTGSQADIRVLYQFLHTTEMMYSGLQGIPFVLSRVEEDTKNPKRENGKRTGTVIVKRANVYLDVRPDYVQRRLNAAIVGKLQAAGDEYTIPQLSLSQLQGEKKTLPSPRPNRISTEEKSGDTVQGKATPKSQIPNWTHEKKTREQFIKDCKSKLELNLDDVLKAFQQSVSYPVEKIEDYREDIIAAAGAVIAFKCGYNLTQIDALSSEKGYDYAVYEAAKQVVEFVNSQDLG